MPTVTIGFIHREQFSLAAESLQRLFDCTRQPFNLIVADCNTPLIYKRQIREVLKGRPNVTIVERDHYLLPNQARNLVLPLVKDDFLCFLDNDVLVEDGWLTHLLAACAEQAADVAVPLMLEGRPGSQEVHWDDKLGSIVELKTGEGVKLQIAPNETVDEMPAESECRTIQTMESHCLLFRTDVFDRIRPYDEELSRADEVDLSLALYSAKVPVVFQPKSVIHLIPPFILGPDEHEYFFMKWDLARSHKSLHRIQAKWNLTQLPAGQDFVKDRLLIGSMHLAREELISHISPDQPCIFVDGDEWRGSEAVAGLQTLPFTEHNGEYWGPPGNDERAIQEVERLRQAGACFLVVTWRCFWYFDHYADWNRHLRSRYACLLENERLAIFDLQEPQPTHV